jgi:hypothetical protein
LEQQQAPELINQGEGPHGHGENAGGPAEDQVPMQQVEYHARQRRQQHQGRFLHERQTQKNQAHRFLENLGGCQGAAQARELWNGGQGV